MSGRQTDHRQTGTHEQGGGLGAPGTTGAAGARDPLGAPGSTGASRTTMGAPGYDPTDYGIEGGGQQQLHRTAADEGTGQGYTYGTAGSMGETGTGYHAGVHIPHSTGTTGKHGTGGSGQQRQLHRPTAGEGTGQGYTAGRMGQTGTGNRGGVNVPHSTGTAAKYRLGGDFDTGDSGRAAGVGGVGEGYDTGMGERAHGVGKERGGHLGVTSDTVIIESVGVGGGGGNDAGEVDEWAARGVSGESGRTHGGYDTGGARQKEGQRRG